VRTGGGLGVRERRHGARGAREFRFEGTASHFDPGAFVKSREGRPQLHLRRERLDGRRHQAARRGADRAEHLRRHAASGKVMVAATSAASPTPT
jgi:hypothetical protein